MSSCLVVYACLGVAFQGIALSASFAGVAAQDASFAEGHAVGLEAAYLIACFPG